MNSMAQLAVEVMRRGNGADWHDLGHVNAVYQDDLVLFSYTNAAQYEGRWNWFEQVSRGLIVNWQTGEIVARPFDKFWNWGEGGRTTEADVVSVTEKIDGSLGILYRHRGQYCVATRGSFDSEQARWATAFFRFHYNSLDLPDGMTYLFEIVYPENRVVVDYEDQRGLYLLAARNRFTGQYDRTPDIQTMAQAWGLLTPQVYDIDRVDALLALAQNLTAEHEGWVVEFADGQRFKIKGAQYLELHRLLTGTSKRRVVEWLRNGTYEQRVQAAPDEFLWQISGWRDEILAHVADVQDRARLAFELAPKDSRKTFALWVRTECPDLASYLFQLFDGRDVVPLIYRQEF